MEGKKIENLRNEDRKIIFYESPHRLLKTLNDRLECFGDRQVAVARELTKKFEEVKRGKLSEVIGYFSTHTIRGEFVLVVEGNESGRKESE